MPVYKIANKSALHTYQILPSSNRLNLFLLSFTHVLKKIETTMRWKKSASFSTNNGRTSRLSSFYRIIVNHKNFILKYLDNTFKFLLNFTNIEAATAGKSTSERFWKNSSKRREIRLLIRLRLLCRTNVFLNLKYFWWKSYGNHNRKSIFYRASAFKWSYWSFYWFRSCLFLPSDGHVDFETEFFTPFYLDTQFGKTFLIICNFFGVLKKLIILGTSYQNL